MTKGRHLLTHRQVESLVKSGVKSKIRDGGGLWLSINGIGRASWVSKFTIVQRGVARGTPKEVGIGAYPLITLQEARELHASNKDLASRGIDPSQRLKDERMTFEHVFWEYFEQKRKTLNNEKNIKQWQSTMKGYVFPVIGNIDVDHISHHDISDVLRPIWTDIPDTSSKILQRIHSVLEYAIAHDYRKPDNPANLDRLKHILPSLSVPIKQTNHPFIPPERFPDFFRYLTQYWEQTEGRPKIVAGALILSCFTTARSNTVRHAKWCDIDFDAGFWLPPPQTMKFAHQIRYPLSTQAQAFLNRITHNGEYIFPARDGSPLRDHALSHCLRECMPSELVYSDTYDKLGNRRKSVPHGIRSTFSTWANEQGFDDLIIEKSLAHKDKNRVRAAYQRSDLAERRRVLLEQWGQFITGEVS